jgi:hypothetical protein
MSKKIEYKLIVEQNPVSLNQTVNAWTSQGWQPIGGIAIGVIPKSPNHSPMHELIYAQSLMKEPH